MIKYRNPCPKIDPKTDDIILNIIDWDSSDKELDDSSDSDDSFAKFTIQIFGITKQGNSVCVNVNNFTPYFFVKIPNDWNKIKIKSFIQSLKNTVYSQYKSNLIKHKIVQKKIFHGFTNNKLEKFIRLVFNNYKAYCSYRYVIDKLKISIPGSKPTKFIAYETNIHPSIRFIHINNIKPAGWIKIPANKYKLNNPSISESRCQIDITTKKFRYVKPIEIDEIAPFIVASFDIECISEDIHKFPTPDIPGNHVTQIGTTARRYGESECFLHHIITLKSCDTITNIENTIVESYDDEKDVLLAWTRFIKELDPDIITGYNIFGFDYKYLYTRAKLYHIEDEFSDIGRLKDVECKLITKELISSALGENKLCYMPMTGRVNIDIMKVVMRDYKLSSYKLDNVSNEFMKGNMSFIEKINDKTISFLTLKNNILKKNNYITIYINKERYGNKKYKIKKIIDDSDSLKIILKYKNYQELDGKLEWCLSKDDINHLQIFSYQSKGPEYRKIIAEYCIQDCVLCNNLIDKLDIITKNIGMANVCSVPLSYIFMRGQGIKIFSLVAKKCKKENFIIPVKKYKKSGNSIGYEGAIVLVPEIGMYLDNPISVLDYSSLYPSSMISHNLSSDSIVLEEQYNNLPDYTYDDVTYDIYTGKGKDKHIIGKRTCRYAQFPNNEKGILPQILMELLKQRKETRKKIKTESDPFKRSMLDGQQLAYKLTANSLYGQLGAPTSPIYFKEIAASTTAVGRELLHFAKDFTEENFDATCVYGDSIVGDEPLLLKKDGLITLITIEELCNEWKPYHEFKKHDSNRKEKEQSHTKYQVWCDGKWSNIKRVIRHKTLKKIYRINTHCGVVDVTEDHSLLDINGKIIKPSKCIANQTKLLQSYPNDISTIHSNITNTFILPTKNIYKTSNKKKAATIYIMIKSLGYYPYITLSDNSYIIKYTQQKCIHHNIIHNITFLRNSINEYVYDLETEEGLFQAGVGEIIVKNTDSVFIKYNLTDDNGKKLTGLKALKKSIEMGIKTEKAIQPLLRSPHVLEYEKTFYPFILLSKKRYVGNLYEKDINKFYRKSMGIVLKRRDNANIVKKVYGGIIDIIMSEKNIKKAITFLEKAMNDILKGTYPIEDFVITKTLRGHYKNPGSISHKVLADRMKERDPGSAPNTNERVPYAFIQIKKNKVIESKKKKIMTYLTSFSKKYTHTNKINKLAEKYTTKINNICNLGDEFNNVQHTLKLLATSNSSSNIIKHKILGLISKRIKVLQGDRVEHPNFIKKHKLPLDYNYYITNQIMKPVKQIFDLVMDNTHIIFDDIIRKDKNKTNNNQEITKWFASDKKSDSNYDKYKWKD